MVHLISEGAEAWQTEDCVLADRNKIIEDIDNLIEKWKARNFKVMFTGRQLDDIVEFLNSFDNSICQKWSCWILSQGFFFFNFNFIFKPFVNFYLKQYKHISNQVNPKRIVFLQA